MRRTLLAAAVAAILPAVPADAAAANAARCSKGKPAVTVTMKGKRHRACAGAVVANTPEAAAAAGRSLLSVASLQPPRGARRGKLSELLALHRVAPVRLAEVPRARAAINPYEPPTSKEATGPDSGRVEWRQDGEVMEVSGSLQTLPDFEGAVTGQRGDLRGTVTKRDGRRMELGLVGNHQAPRCPSADGQVPATFADGLSFGDGALSHGKRTWRRAMLEVEGPWKGYVGLGGKVERYDVDLRGVVEVRSAVEVAATGKVLQRGATRTYRTALTLKGLPMGTDPDSLYDRIRAFGPKGRRGSADEVRVVGMLAAQTADAVRQIEELLRAGDRRWYDQMSCAKARVASTAPERVAPNGSGSFEVEALASDGTPVADAAWTADSVCGAVAPATARGRRAGFTVTDAAGAWKPRTRGACLAAQATSPAGRTPSADATIPPLDTQRYRIDVGVTYDEVIPDAADTQIEFLGSAVDELDDEYSDGEGTWGGIEWDGTITNPCGEDMNRTRQVEGKLTMGVKVNADGTVTVAIGAAERPLRWGWIETFPLTGGTITRTGAQPFCGEPGHAKTTAVIRVTVTPV